MEAEIGDAAGAIWQYHVSWVSAGLPEKGSYGSFGKAEL